MLTRLHVKNFALIEETAIEFGPGLNVITGETGAGKSILIGALNSILGDQASADLVRTGADKCTVEGSFEFAPDHPTSARLRALGFDLQDGQLVLRREIHAAGRSRAFANGQALPLKKLKEIGAILVDLHGQHEHQSLLDVDLHANFLDEFGGLAPQAAAVAGLYHRHHQLEQDLRALQQERDTLHHQEELRQFQLKEIRQLDPDPQEEVHLERELNVLKNIELLVTTSTEIFDALYQAEGSIVEQLGRARRQLDRLLEADPTLEPHATALEGLVYGIEDVATSLRDYAQKLEISPERADLVRDRLNALGDLKRKYGGALEKVLAFVGQLERQENRTGELDGEIEKLEKEVEQVLQQFGHACRELSQGRYTTTQALAQAVEKGLKTLEMEQTTFKVELASSADPEGLVEHDGEHWHADERGMETVEFYISANPGETPRPLARVASGGEISRIMLVLKEVIADKDTVATLVFDEIDTGISGRVAATVGKKLQSLSASHQLIAITHLPQIASAAERHFSVRKRQHTKRTLTEVYLLDQEERTEEIAYLLAGEKISDSARRHAREMLK